jgi:hypothetical protein
VIFWGLCPRCQPESETQEPKEQQP